MTDDITRLKDSILEKRGYVPTTDARLDTYRKNSCDCGVAFNTRQKFHKHIRDEHINR